MGAALDLFNGITEALLKWPQERIYYHLNLVAMAERERDEMIGKNKRLQDDLTAVAARFK